ncbi:MAG TPA: hypothetical protein VFB15_01370 [Candidatus Binataceae bacterium]|jgi:Tfp pilus assembly protein PilN|nr:hypothetical protein [Candidatus Binataceae bacterium]
MVWIAALMLMIAVALFVAAPLAEGFAIRPQSRSREAEIAQLEHEHRLALAAIREIDFDHAMGKISDSEYQMLRHRFETRALTAMAALARFAQPNAAAPSGQS